MMLETNYEQLFYFLSYQRFQKVMESKQYCDLSIIPTNRIELGHIVKRIKQQKLYHHIALDYEFKDCQIKAPTQLINLDTQHVQVHTRATLLIQQSATLHQLGVPRNQFSLIALKPLNQKIFSAICSQYDNYDILSLDFGNKLPFMLKRNPVYECIRRGKFFQIQYDSMFDENKRIYCMTNIVNLIKATNGKNIIVSSHCSEYSQHRTPYDVVSLLVTLGMTKEQAFSAIKTTPLEVLKSSAHRKYFKGIIKEIQPIMVAKIGKKISKHKQRIKNMIKNSEKQI